MNPRTRRIRRLRRALRWALAGEFSDDWRLALSSCQEIEHRMGPRSRLRDRRERWRF